MPDIDNRVLLVDDDAAVARAYARALTKQGWEVESAADGREAVGRLRDHAFAVIISDVAMPRMSGLDFLRSVRAHDLDVPVILVSGAPDLETSLRAIEFGAFRFLTKPVDLRLLGETVLHAAQLHSLARLKRDALEVAGVERRRLGDRAGLEARFALAMRMLWMAYQPVVSLKSHTVFGYEALLRLYEPSLRSAVDILDAARRLDRIPELGRAIRGRVSDDAARLPAGANLLVNLDAMELNDAELYAADGPLARARCTVVLELTERESLEGVRDVAARVARLRALGFLVAVDDLGSGYAGLGAISQLEPEIAKLDMSMIRSIDVEPRKRSIVRSIVELCDELGTIVVAEGVETVAERDVLADLGCDLVQGFLFARPDQGFPAVQW